MPSMKKNVWKGALLVLLMPLLLVATNGHAHALMCGTLITTSGSCDVAVAGVIDAGLLTMTTVSAAVNTSPLDGGGTGHTQLNG